MRELPVLLMAMLVMASPTKHWYEIVYDLATNPDC